MFPLAQNRNHRIAIGVEYNGHGLHGWQRQGDPEVATVQGYLEKAIATVADHPVSMFCAGRTDAGVHGTGQVAHFDVKIDRGEKAWVMGVNSNLPTNIRIKWAKNVDKNFHARHSAIYRRYEYWVENTPVASAIRAGQITWFRKPLNEKLMHGQAQALLGEQDFSSFQAAACQSRTAMRCVQEVSVERFGDRIFFTIQANAFLLHMVRNIVGALLEVGSGDVQEGFSGESYIKDLLAKKDRTLAPPTAKPDGLYLVEVGYPDQQPFEFDNSEIFV